MNKVPHMFFPASIVKTPALPSSDNERHYPCQNDDPLLICWPLTQEAQSYRQGTQLTAQWSSCSVHGKHDVHLLERELQNLHTQGTLKNMYSAVGDSQCLIPIFIYLAPKPSTFVPHASFSPSRWSNESHTVKPGSAQKKFLISKERNPKIIIPGSYMSYILPAAATLIFREREWNLISLM